MKADTILLILMLAAVLGNIALSVSRILHVHGTRRFFAGLPILAMLLLGTRIVFNSWQDSTSHNLWPFEIMLISAVGIIYSVGCLGLEAASRGRKSPPDSTVHLKGA